MEAITRRDLAKMAYQAYVKVMNKQMKRFDELTELEKEAWEAASNEALRSSMWLENHEIEKNVMSKHYMERYFGLNVRNINQDFSNRIIISLEE